MNDDIEPMQSAGLTLVVVHPGPPSIEDLLRSIDPAADHETERFVAAIYADRREAFGIPVLDERTAIGMSAPDPIYLELVDLIAAGSTPETVADFHPSPEAHARVAELVERERKSQLTTEEASELAHFIELEHILRLVKARARLILAKRT